MHFSGVDGSLPQNSGLQPLTPMDASFLLCSQPGNIHRGGKQGPTMQRQLECTGKHNDGTISGCVVTNTISKQLSKLNCSSQQNQ